MQTKNPFRFSLTFLTLLALLTALFAMSAFGSGPDDAPSIISLEDVGKPADKDETHHTMFDPQNDSNASNSSQQRAIMISEPRTEGEISSLGEVDEYWFSAADGDRVYVALQSASSTASDDTLIDIVAPDGSTVLERDDDDGSFSFLSSNIAGVPITETGSYNLKVKHSNDNRTITPYYLHYQLQSGTPDNESEPNDTTVAAQDLPASGWVVGTISSGSDKDLYQINLTAGDNLFIALDMDPERDGVTWDGRAGLGVLANTFVVSNDGSTTSPNSEAFFLTVKESGTYFVYVDAISGAGADATYHLSVQVQPKTAVT